MHPTKYTLAEFFLSDLRSLAAQASNWWETPISSDSSGSVQIQTATSMLQKSLFPSLNTNAETAKEMEMKGAEASALQGKLKNMQSSK